jgi:cell wall-associated NlpC family hydrolase
MIKSLIGTPYVWWIEGDSTTKADAPFYCRKVPTADIIKTTGCNCAGLINLLAHKQGLPIPGMREGYWYAGGTYAWHHYLEDKGILEPIDTKKEYPTGSLLLRKYRDPKDQGHLAVLFTGGLLLEQRLLHCHSKGGITIDDTVASSHSWLPEGYYEYIAPGFFAPNILEE